MRRKDREQSEEFGWSVLETCPYAVLSTTDDEGLPYGIPVSPAVLDGVIYFHSAKHGTKSKLLRKHPDVCLVGVRDVVPLPEAYSTEYASAVVRGTVAEVLDHFRTTEPKGEFVIVVAGKPKVRRVREDGEE